METKRHPCRVISLISFSTSGPSPAHVTALYSMDEEVGVDDEWLNVLQPVRAIATAHPNDKPNNLLVITPYSHSQPVLPQV
ncbi:MAG TPA: hypothetical protein VGY98_01255 [Verrucomicrobiae bacterium]|nr:hypothetical protein [Verrucomicrobiae bacterium]